MLLIIAFACFAILFVAWLLAPSSPGALHEPEVPPMRAMPEAGASTA